MLQGGRVASIMACGIVATFTGGCRGESKPPQDTQGAYAPKPAYYMPNFPAESVLKVPLDRIRKYADKLHFEPTLGAADELPVDFQRGRIGTKRGRQTRIEPESASYRLSDQELAQGRIIARLRSEAEVPRLGLGPRWTWWWVDKNGPRGSWRSVFIAESEKPAYRIELKNSFELMEHGSGYWHQAVARFWLVREESPKGDPIWLESWGTCGSCCRQRLVVLAPE
ncbi:MAG TPA: hypothetical protein VK647_13880 [Gemmatimonadales bacterium]|jgi:hypothetical protein|nr:hypothetical protein [Gemmatimonadales bacterium]